MENQQQSGSAVQSRALAEKLYNKSQELERELKVLLRKKPVFDKSCNTIRQSIRDNDEKILFIDFEYGSSKDVEQSLWKTVYYKVIEEYRKRIRKHVSLLKNAEKLPTTHSPSSQSTNKPNDELQKICESFKNFLASATKFYQELVKKLQLKYNLSLDGSIDYYSEGQNNIHKSYLSCHRCFIFLGDLARYHRDLVGHPSQGDWVKAATYYNQALHLVPDNGNPHNQLAVLATYADDEFESVYHYFLCLGVAHPFLTARENLIVLFEKNRLKLAQLEESMAMNMAASMSQPSKSGKKTSSSSQSNSQSQSMVKLFLTRLIRLHGVIFTKTSLEKFDEIQTQIFRELETVIKEEKLLSDQLLLHIFVINMFSIYNVTWTPEGHNPTYAEISQRSGLFKSAVNFALEFFVRVLKHSHTPTPRYLVTISVFLDYLKSRPDFLRKPRSQDVDKENVTNPSLWNVIWKELAILINQINLDEEEVESKRDRDSDVDKFAFPLPEENELRGFIALKQVYSKIPFSNQSFEEQQLEQQAQMDTNGSSGSVSGSAGSSAAQAKRRAKIIQFGKIGLYYDQETHLYSDVAFSTIPNLIGSQSQQSQFKGKEKERSQGDNTSQKVPSENLTAPSLSDVMSTSPVESIDFEDEVILFKPGEGPILIPGSHGQINQSYPSSMTVDQATTGNQSFKVVGSQRSSEAKNEQDNISNGIMMKSNSNSREDMNIQSTSTLPSSSSSSQSQLHSPRTNTNSSGNTSTNTHTLPKSSSFDLFGGSSSNNSLFANFHSVVPTSPTIQQNNLGSGVTSTSPFMSPLAISPTSSSTNLLMNQNQSNQLSNLSSIWSNNPNTNVNTSNNMNIQNHNLNSASNNEGFDSNLFFGKIARMENEGYNNSNNLRYNETPYNNNLLNQNQNQNQQNPFLSSNSNQNSTSVNINSWLSQAQTSAPYNDYQNNYSTQNPYLNENKNKMNNSNSNYPPFNQMNQNQDYSQNQPNRVNLVSMLQGQQPQQQQPQTRPPPGYNFPHQQYNQTPSNNYNNTNTNMNMNMSNSMQQPQQQYNQNQNQYNMNMYGNNVPSNNQTFPFSHNDSMGGFNQNQNQLLNQNQNQNQNQNRYRTKNPFVNN